MHISVSDILSISRAVFSPLLLCLDSLSREFLVFYAVLWLTDMADGPLARRTRTAAPRGQVLDSSADAVLAVSMLLCVVPAIDPETWTVVGMGIVIVIRTVALGIGTGRHGRAAFVHSYLNKAAGMMLCLLPYLICFFGLDTAAAAGGIVFAAASVEYLYINCTSETLDRDEKSAFFGRHRT